MARSISAGDGASVIVITTMPSSIDGGEASIVVYELVRVYACGWFGQWGSEAVAMLELGFGRGKLVGGERRGSGMLGFTETRLSSRRSWVCAQLGLGWSFYRVSRGCSVRAAVAPLKVVMATAQGSWRALPDGIRGESGAPLLYIRLARAGKRTTITHIRSV